MLQVRWPCSSSSRVDGLRRHSRVQRGVLWRRRQQHVPFADTPAGGGAYAGSTALVSWLGVYRAPGCRH